MARIASLARFPVKSCGAEPCTELAVDVDGARHDRMLAVVAGDKILTQREHPVLARVRPRLDDATSRLSLTCLPGEGNWPSPVSGTVTVDGPARTVTIFGTPVEVVEQSADLSAWFAEVLGTPARLVAAPPSTRRVSPGAVRGLTALSDEGTLSLHSLASLDRLNERVVAGGGEALPADRFRANVVLSHCAAHAEDDTDRFEVDGGTDRPPVQLRFADQDARCVMTTIDQQAGRRAGPEPIRALAGYRRGPSGGVLFGVYVAVTRPGILRVDDTVRLDGQV